MHPQYNSVKLLFVYHFFSNVFLNARCLCIFQLPQFVSRHLFSLHSYNCFRSLNIDREKKEMSFLKKLNFNLNCDRPESFVGCQVSVLDDLITDFSSINCFLVATR